MKISANATKTSSVRAEMIYHKFSELTAEQCIAGARAAAANARELATESAILFQHRHFARAYSLAHCSREELGKASMLIATALRLHSGIPVDWKKLGKRFRSHANKIVNERLMACATIPPDMAIKAGLVSDASEWHAAIFAGANGEYWEKRRNDSLYADWNGSVFVTPATVVSEEQARRTMVLAQIGVNDVDAAISSAEVSISESPGRLRESVECVYDIMKTNGLTERQMLSTLIAAAHDVASVSQTEG